MPSLIGQSLGLRHQEPDHCPQPAPRASLHFASAVACEPGTYFSGESSQCVPCTPGSYQDGEGQLSCTPCPSSDGLGLAGARNVSECGGECGHSWGEAQPGRGGDGVGTGWGRGASCLHGDPKATARSQVMYCKVPCSLQSLSSLPYSCS